VIRWAWAAGVSALVLAQATTDQGIETQTLIRLIHDLSELMDSRSREELEQPGSGTPAGAAAPERAPAEPSRRAPADAAPGK
jgi:hypothetical protein